MAKVVDDVRLQVEYAAERRIGLESRICDDTKCIVKYYPTTPETGLDWNGIKPPPLDDWLPITESRKGNSWTSTFLLLCSGIGIQALSLPLAFVSLGWFWGILCLSVAFLWQLYTTGLLVNLHESASGTRYSRYLHLSIVAFGGKLGKLLVVFPLMYLSGGTCVMMIITGSGTMNLFYQLLCEDCSQKNLLTGAQWFLVFTCLAILVALFCPNLNSLAMVSVLGSVAAVAYCTILWVVPVAKGQPGGTIHDPSKAAASEIGRIRGILNAFGFVTIAFRGHNVMLEIQGTMPSSPKRSSSKPIWRGVKISYLVIAMSYFPLAIAGYWAYGNNIPINGGLLTAFSTSLHYKASKPVLGLVYLLIVVSCVATYQIYGMVVFDNLQRLYSIKKNKKCPKLIRLGIRVFFGGLTYFIAVTFPFLPKLGPLIGGIALPVTLGYPCFMWIAIKRPPMKSVRWWFNFGLGCLGIGLSVLLAVAAAWNLACRGLEANFFHPH